MDSGCCGKPLQLSEGAETPRGRWSTALEIALDRGDYSLVHLLLFNGYDPIPVYPFDQSISNDLDP